MLPSRQCKLSILSKEHPSTDWVIHVPQQRDIEGCVCMCVCTKNCHKNILDLFMGLTGRADYGPDSRHRDGRWWDGYESIGMPTSMALLGRPIAGHRRGYCNTKRKHKVQSQIAKTERKKETWENVTWVWTTYRGWLRGCHCETPEPEALKRPARGWVREDDHPHLVRR